MGPFPRYTVRDVASIIVSEVSSAISGVFGRIVGSSRNVEDRSISSDPELQKILKQLSYSFPLDEQGIPIIEYETNGQEKIIFTELSGSETVDSRLIARESFKTQAMDLIGKLDIDPTLSNDLTKLLNSEDYVNLLDDFENILKKTDLSTEAQKEFMLGVKGALIGTRNLIELFQGGLAQQLVSTSQPQIPPAPPLPQTSIPAPPPPPSMPPGGEVPLFERLKRAGAVALPGMGAVFEQIRDGVSLRKTSVGETREPELSQEEIEKRRFVSELKSAVSGEGRKRILKTSIDPEQERERRRLERENEELQQRSMFGSTKLKRTRSESPIGSGTKPEDERQTQSEPPSPRLND